MATFQSPVDIWNRALDHAGGRAVTAAPPADESRNAAKCAEIYDKVRQAELRRNNWVFSTRKVALRPIDVSTMLLVPNAYSASTQYVVGDIVSYLSENWLCILGTPLNGGVAPVDSNGVVAPNWDNYFGPMTVDAWRTSANGPNIATSYHAGEIVYLAPGNGLFSVFLSLVDGNTDDPLQPDAWSNGTSYSAGQIVEGSDGNLYQSATSFNLGNDPTITSPAAAWLVGTTYAAGVYIYYSDGQIYQSLVGGNVGNAPPASLTAWVATGMWNNAWGTTLTPQPRATSNKWHFLACSLQPLAIVFPVGSSPLSQPQSKNLFMLPNNFLMRAPEEDTLGNRVPWLGAHEPMAKDYVFQGNYIISWRASVIVLRFISDFQNVTLMDPMFCEGLGARMGWELAETLTQKPELKQACLMAYDKQMGEARTINAIEVGPIAEVEDEYISVRL